MTSTTNILNALIQQLPDTPTPVLEQLAQIITDVARENISINEASALLRNNPSIAQVLLNLSGREVNTANAAIVFGNENNIGDINIRDIATGNIVHLNFHINPIDLPQTPLAVTQQIKLASSRISNKRYREAIVILSRLIENYPNYEAYFHRAKARKELAVEYNRVYYKKLWNKEKEAENYKDRFQEYGKLAIEDATDAITLAAGKKEIRAARRLRISIPVELNFYVGFEESDSDMEWLANNSEGLELAEVFLAQVSYLDERDYLFEDSYEEALELLARVEELGLSNSLIARFRAQAYFGAKNYGLALKETDRAIELAANKEELLAVQNMKAWTLVKMEDFRKAFDLAALMRQSHENFDGAFFIMNFDIRVEILSKLALEVEYATLTEVETADRLSLINQLESYEPYFVTFNKELAAAIQKFKRKYSK